MELREMNWDGANRTKLTCVGYKNDMNTVNISRKLLYPLKQFFGLSYNKYAIQKKSGAYGDIFKLYHKIGNYYTEVRIYINPYEDMEDLRAFVDKLIAAKVTEKDTWVAEAEAACATDNFIRLADLEVLAQWDDTADLIKRCMTSREKYMKRREEERNAHELELREKEKAKEEQEKRERHDEMVAAIEKIKKGEEVSVVGTNIIEDICHEYDIKIPIRTLGWIRDNLVSVQYSESEKSWGLRYTKRKKGSKVSNKIWEILEEIRTKLNEEEENDA